MWKRKRNLFQIYGPRWKENVPRFAANLGYSPLEPSKPRVPSAELSSPLHVSFTTCVCASAIAGKTYRAETCITRQVVVVVFFFKTRFLNDESITKGLGWVFLKLFRRILIYFVFIIPTLIL